MTTCTTCHRPNGAHAPTCTVLDEALAAPPMTIVTTITLPRPVRPAPSLSQLTGAALALAEGLDTTGKPIRVRIVLWFIRHRLRRLHRKAQRGDR